MAKSPTPPRRLEYLPVDDLPDHPRNPRDHRLPDLRASVLRFGYTDPALLDGRTGLLAEGHGRKKATIDLRDNPPDPLPDVWPPEGIVLEDGTWYVPVVHGWSSKDDAEAEAYLLAGNQGGGWRNDVLGALLDDLAARPAGLEGTGFDAAAHDLVLSELAIGTPGPAQDPDDEWAGMPDFSGRDLASKWRIKVHFPTEDDYKAFLKMLGDPTVRQASIWWPRDDGHQGADLTQQYVGED